jgi:hypothetical protein
MLCFEIVAVGAKHQGVWILMLYADDTGRFTVEGVPPGNYRIYVWESAEPSQYFDRELIARTRPLALPVRVEKGPGTSVTVTTIGP